MIDSSLILDFALQEVARSCQGLKRRCTHCCMGIIDAGEGDTHMRALQWAWTSRLQAWPGCGGKACDGSRRGLFGSITSLLPVFPHYYLLEHHYYIHYYIVITSLLHIITVIMASLLPIITFIITLLLLIITSVITSLLHIITCSLLPIITVIMGSLLLIITRSIMGNNGSIITHYRPPQLGDEELKLHTVYAVILEAIKPLQLFG